MSKAVDFLIEFKELLQKHNAHLEVMYGYHEVDSIDINFNDELFYLEFSGPSIHQEDVDVKLKQTQEKEDG